MPEGTGTEEYYRLRAAEYDLAYAKPERQADLKELRNRVAGLLLGRRVLEVAAGTGWWTDVYADGAAGVVATDVNPETLAVATARRHWPPEVRFAECDAFGLGVVEGGFDAAFVGFFWSHVPRQGLDRWLAGVSARLDPGALLVALDNRFVAGSNLPITRTDELGNTYQQRRLQDGTSFEVLKNFPTPAELRASLRPPMWAGVQVEELEYYWLATATAGASVDEGHDGCHKAEADDE